MTRSCRDLELRESLGQRRKSCRDTMRKSPPHLRTSWPRDMYLVGVLLLLVISLGCSHGRTEKQSEDARLCEERSEKELSRPGTRINGCEELRPSQYPFNPKLHVLSIYDSQGLVEVIIKGEKEVALVLAAYNPATWKFTLLDGATVQRVVLGGPASGTTEIEGLPRATQIQREVNLPYAHGWEPKRNKGGGRFKELIRVIREHFKGTEASFQGCYSGSVFQIPIEGERPADCGDGSEPSYYACPGPTVTHFDRVTAQNNIVIGDDGRTVSVPERANSVNDSVRAIPGFRSGRFYFEVTVARLGNGSFGAIGLETDSFDPELTVGSVGAGCGYERSGHIACGGEPVSEVVEEYEQGDVIGVAANLDSGFVYFRRNDQWIVGSPESHEGGLALPTALREMFYPAVTISNGDLLVANFGTGPFRYQVPSGFRAGWW